MIPGIGEYGKAAERSGRAASTSASFLLGVEASAGPQRSAPAKASTPGARAALVPGPRSRPGPAAVPRPWPVRCYQPLGDIDPLFKGARRRTAPMASDPGPDLKGERGGDTGHTKQKGKGEKAEKGDQRREQAE